MVRLEWPDNDWLSPLLAELSDLSPLKLPMSMSGETAGRRGDWLGRHPLEPGSEAEDHRVYQAGDSIRHINWRLSARSDQWFVKYQPRPSAVRVRLLVDLRSSAWQGSRVRLKAAQVVRASFRVAHRMISLAVVETHLWSAVPIVLPALLGQASWMGWCEQWVRSVPDVASTIDATEPALSDALLGVSAPWLMVVSDLLDWDDALQHQLMLAVDRGPVCLIHVLDASECELPRHDGVRWGAQVGLSVSDAGLCQTYAERQHAFVQSIVDWCAGLGICYWPCRADDELSALGCREQW